jgi:uncharacterized protein (DUF111 family)
MCGTRDVERVTEALFLHTTTAGVRRVPSERTTLPRQQLRVALASGEAVSVKLLETPQGFRVKAEYEDVRLVASRSGRPALDVAREAEMAARAMIGVATPHSQAHREE